MPRGPARADDTATDRRREMTGGRRPAARPKTTPPVDPPPVAAPAPWWLPVATGVGSGLLAVGIALVTAINKLELDTFTMAMLFLGVALAAGVNASVLFGRPIVWFARIFSAAGKDRDT